MPNDEANGQKVEKNAKNGDKCSVDGVQKDNHFTFIFLIYINFIQNFVMKND